MANLFPSSWHGQRRKTADADEKDDRQRETNAGHTGFKTRATTRQPSAGRRSSDDDVIR